MSHEFPHQNDHWYPFSRWYGLAIFNGRIFHFLQQKRCRWFKIKNFETLRRGCDYNNPIINLGWPNLSHVRFFHSTPQCCNIRAFLWLLYYHHQIRNQYTSLLEEVHGFLHHSNVQDMTKMRYSLSPYMCVGGGGWDIRHTNSDLYSMYKKSKEKQSK